MKNNKKLNIFVLAIVAVLTSGCARDRIWVNPTVTNEQAQKDMAECKYDSVKYAPGYNFVGDPIAAGFARGMRENDIISVCMSSKGYSLQEKREQAQPVKLMYLEEADREASKKLKEEREKTNRLTNMKNYNPVTGKWSNP